MIKIPFNRPNLTGRELGYIRDAIETHIHISGDGTYTLKCQALLQRLLGTPKALLTTSCTHALELTALLLNIRAGDEVIVPSFAFVSTANAFVLFGATPIFVDVRPDTLNIDESQLEAAITPRTKAIVTLHYAGVSCEMDPIMAIATRHGVAVVEDNAHTLFGKYKNRYTGTFGALAAQSFHETKNFSCGEGGALLINDDQYTVRAEVLREKGTNRSRFFRGQVDKYTWIDVGSSYLPSDILAAFLYAQLESRDDIELRRRQIWESYQAGLCDWAHERDIMLPTVPPHVEQSYHMFYMLLPSFPARQAFIKHMENQGILCVFHYLPLHVSPMGRGFGGKTGDCPVTENVSDRLVRLPFYTTLDPVDQECVIAAARRFKP